MTRSARDTSVLLTALGRAFRSFKSEEGLRPIYDSKSERSAGRPFVTVLAYQLVQVIQRRFLDRAERAVARREDSSSLHVRVATRAGHSTLHAIRRGPDGSLVSEWERHWRVQTDSQF